jgi:hypothetical protein
MIMRWQYKLLELDLYGLEGYFSRIEELGRDGWELICEPALPSGTERVYFIFKSLYIYPTPDYSCFFKMTPDP